MYENKLYSNQANRHDPYSQDVRRRSRRKRRRRRKKQRGCCGSCVLPFLVCVILLFVFREQYPVTLLTDFIHDPIQSTSEDPLPDLIAGSDETAAESNETVTGVPVEVIQGENQNTDASVSTAQQGIYTGLCYKSMTAEERLIYEQLFEGIESLEPEFQIAAKDPDAIGDILNGLLADNPQFFWLDGGASIYGFEQQANKKIKLEFNCDPEEIDDLSARIWDEVEKYLQMLPENASDYEKVKTAYEFVINNVSYDLDAYQSQNLQSSMIYHSSVCAGYAKEMQYLLHIAGVECLYVTGTVTRGDSIESHAWNLVKIDDTYTYVDVTWGDPSYVMTSEAARELPDISYNYLCLTSEEMERTGHVADEKFQLPECTSEAYDYYNMSGRYYESCDTEAIRMQIRNAVDNNVADVHMKFANLEDYYEAQAAIFDGGMLSEELQNRMKWDGLTTITYYPLTNDYLHTIEILW